MAKVRAEKKTEKLISGLLKKASERMNSFTFGVAKFEPKELAEVAALIGNKIPVFLVESEKGFCRYMSGAVPTDNEILIDRKSVNGKSILGTIVHEAIHAANDLYSRKIHSSIDEGVAYVGQMMFLEKINISAGGHEIFDLAQAVYDAIKIPKGKDKKKLELALVKAVEKEYTPVMRNYNGIK